MTATADDVALFSNDGVLLTARDLGIKAAHPNAQDGGGDEIVTFFDTQAAGQFILDERFAMLSAIGRMHEAVEIEDSLGLGADIPVVPAAPHFYVIDESRSLAGRAVLAAYSFDHNTDRYALELIGTIVPDDGVDRVTMDSTEETFDDTSHSMDES